MKFDFVTREAVCSNFQVAAFGHVARGYPRGGKRGQTYLSESVHKVGLQKSISAQIRQLILDISNTKDKLTNLRGNWSLQNNFINTLCEIKTHP